MARYSTASLRPPYVAPPSSPREMISPRLLLAVAAMALPLAAPAASAQVELDPAAQDRVVRSLRESTAPRVLFSVSDVVKGDDGTYGTLRTVVTYDPVAGEYVHETRDGAGRTLSRDVQRAGLVAPTPAESVAARRVIATTPEIARLAAAASGEVVIDGGFPLVREPGHPCGPGSRCASYDVFSVSPSGERRRLRYVVVDLGAVRVLDADADADLDGNLDTD